MKYTTEEALSEILRRSREAARVRSRRTCRMLSGLTASLLAVLMLVISAFSNRPAALPEGSIYGSFLLSQEAGGYVLAAVIAFVLGVAVTLFCLWYRKTKHQKTGSSRTTEMEEHL